MKRREFLMLCGASCLASVSAYGRSRRPNIIVVFPDQWRRQALGFMHQDPVLTPNLDKFAQESAVFTQAVTPDPICVPARAALLTGRYPVTNGVTNNGAAMPGDEITIAQLLKRKGYKTGYIGKWHLDGNHFKTSELIPSDRRFGFDFWYAHSCQHAHDKLDYFTGEDTHIVMDGWQPDHETDVAIDFIDKHRDAPFCLFLAWGPPHNNASKTMRKESAPGEQRYSSYAAPREYEQLYSDKDFIRRPNVPDDYARPVLQEYFGAITSCDENFGRLDDYLKAQGLADNTIVVFTSDHGELLGSHGLMGKFKWYEESIGIPMIIRWPGNVVPQYSDALISLVDVTPTLLELVGAKVPKTMQGTSFARYLCGKGSKTPSSAYICFQHDRKNVPHYMDNKRWTDWRAVRTSRYTFVVSVWNGEVEKMLYDLEKDHYQMKPIGYGQGYDDIMRDLERELLGWLERTGDSFPEWQTDRG